MKFKFLAFALVTALALPNAAYGMKKTAVGPEGQRLTASATTNLANNQLVTVTGTKYNKKVGIYLAFCVLPQMGKLPTDCAGGINAEGQSLSSYWISSNPPEYASGLTVPYTQRGGFILKLQVSRFISKHDCATKTCAILTRADHTRSAYRQADVIIPVSFRK